MGSVGHGGLGLGSSLERLISAPGLFVAAIITSTIACRLEICMSFDFERRLVQNIQKQETKVSLTELLAFLSCVDALMDG